MMSRPHEQVDCNLDPGLPHHQSDQGSIKDEPRIFKTIRLVRKCHEPNGDLANEKYTEKIVHHLKEERGVAENVGLVIVCVIGYPQNIEHDHKERHILEVVAP